MMPGTPAWGRTVEQGMLPYILPPEEHTFPPGLPSSRYLPGRLRYKIPPWKTSLPGRWREAFLGEPWRLIRQPWLKARLLFWRSEPMGFSGLIREARTRDDYSIEDAILGFTAQLYALMKEKGMSQADLAAKIGASQPYVARILNGNDNFTIATMVKLAQAVGARMQIVFREADEDPGVETGVGQLVVSEVADSLIEAGSR